MASLKNIGILDYSEDKIKEVISSLTEVKNLGHYSDFIGSKITILESVLKKLSEVGTDLKDEGLDRDGDIVVNFDKSSETLLDVYHRAFKRAYNELKEMHTVVVNGRKTFILDSEDTKHLYFTEGDDKLRMLSMSFDDECRYFDHIHEEYLKYIKKKEYKEILKCLQLCDFNNMMHELGLFKEYEGIKGFNTVDLSNEILFLHNSAEREIKIILKSDKIDYIKTVLCDNDTYYIYGFSKDEFENVACLNDVVDVIVNDSEKSKIFEKFLK